MNLADLIAAARKDNPRVRGVLVYSQSIAGGDYVALCVDGTGVPCDPRSWNTHPTPEAALADLERQITGN